MGITLNYLIRESEIEIRNCEKLRKRYVNNIELVHMYSLKILHYEFMICRLRRHISNDVTPRNWCEIKKRDLYSV